ncbi:AAA domain-containing protein [Nocardia sp. BMG111209]|uniref:AAA domain-containing protein n=1 Tax=Nocardia sp. BMG111209 TaxID=1160137 RepID=UPI000376C471|nr:AAA domain-containing protein [Nocardia sp. BMG111209]
MENDEYGRSVHLTVYLGLGDVGGMLWEQQIKVLQRIGNVKHPALPVFLSGGHIPGSDPNEPGPPRIGAGYVRTRSYEHVDGDEPVGDYADKIAAHLREHPVQALQNLWLIADALSILHDAHIAHRNLWPGILEHEFPREDVAALRLARFEMSSMVANLLRSHLLGATGVEQVRRLYLDQDPRSLPYTPPERLEFLFGDDDSILLSDTADDVFALGMLAAEWLLPATDFTIASARRASLIEVQREVRRTVNLSTVLPRGLARLIHAMLHPVPAERPTMHEVVREFSACYDDALAALEPRHASEPYLVVFMPTYADIQLRELLSESATTEGGKEELSTVIERDFKGAKVTYSKTGAANYLSEGQYREEATTVVFGHEFVWFCSTYFRAGFGGRKYMEQVAVVRHPVPHSKMSPRLQTLRETAPQRTLFAVESVPMDIGGAKLEQMSSGRPSWTELVDPIKGLVTEDGADSVDYLDALDLLLQYQTGCRYAREYAFVRERDGQQRGGETVLRWDRHRDTRRTDNLANPLHVKIRKDDYLRPGMADFFAEADENEDSSHIMIEIRRDIAGQPGTRPEDRVGIYRFLSFRGQDLIIVDSYNLPFIPDTGWIRLADDQAQQTVERRQADAYFELEGNRALLSQLVHPHGGFTTGDKWNDAERRLEGEGGRAVKAMLSHEQMFALQGPPGTGKTEVTSESAAALLEHDPGARLLISAQSHDALDNLAARVLRKVGALDHDDRPQPCDFVAIRAGSDLSFHSVSKTMAQFAENEVARRLIGDIEHRVAENIATGRAHTQRLQEILGEWAASVGRSDIELILRMRKAANLVFATTGAATRDRLVHHGSPEPFDWVLVEEAAKAWPTELIMPLVRGVRWSLIGDQAQIGAYGRQEVERFIDSCYNDPNPRVLAWGEKKERLLEAFDTFGQMFTAGTGSGRRATPVMELTEQRRMHSSIASVVSRTFYATRAAGALKTVRPDVDHGITTPEFLRGRALVWIDTDPTEQAMGFWHNDTEAKIVAALVRALAPRLALSDADGGASLAILTPYREQVVELRGRVSEAASRVFTIDSFQGREADIVIASLVRDRQNKAADAHKSIGHLADPARTNVLISRARTLLVLVGRLPVFESVDSPHWHEITAAVREMHADVPLENTGLAQ